MIETIKALYKREAELLMKNQQDTDVSAELSGIRDVISHANRQRTPVLTVKVMWDDDIVSLLMPATNFVAGAREVRAADLREGQRITVHTDKGKFKEVVVVKPPIWPKADVEVPEFSRASHLALCKKCNHPLHKHPMDRRHEDEYGRPFLTLLCDGSLVKL